MGKNQSLSAGCTSRALVALSKSVTSNFSRQPRLRHNVTVVRHLHHRAQNESLHASRILSTYPTSSTSPTVALLEAPLSSRFASIRSPDGVVKPGSTEPPPKPESKPQAPRGWSSLTGPGFPGMLASMRGPNPIKPPGSTQDAIDKQREEQAKKDRKNIFPTGPGFSGILASVRGPNPIKPPGSTQDAIDKQREEQAKKDRKNIFPTGPGFSGILASMRSPNPVKKPGTAEQATERPTQPPTSRPWGGIPPGSLMKNPQVLCWALPLCPLPLPGFPIRERTPILETRFQVSSMTGVFV
ncbi:hypothetical protein L873DRAFT_1819108 [Choiromyces venosus 120613-1]|uniref:Uncharacterized protein n=1 Tax=Choiromyces venosus 120613-1 TaxID=1336337 RepID=A0A3N4IZK7_9PEZI|nr:hypothetical protein L873DRAFT_1819108 [Choiromyces venosus 120613-1]